MIEVCFLLGSIKSKILNLILIKQILNFLSIKGYKYLLQNSMILVPNSG